MTLNRRNNVITILIKYSTADSLNGEKFVPRYQIMLEINKKTINSYMLVHTKM